MRTPIDALHLLPSTGSGQAGQAERGGDLAKRQDLKPKKTRAGFNRDEGDKRDKGKPLILLRHSGRDRTIDPFLILPPPTNSPIP